MVEGNYYILQSNLSSTKVRLAGFFLICLSIVLFLFVAVSKDNIASPAIVISPSPDITAKILTGPEQITKKEADSRFKYLGWWGKINYSKAGIYKEATRGSMFLGTFSTDNWVKVLEEVKGEMVGANDLWYKIDGGMYPGAYVFSLDVTPIDPPLPPVKLKIPSAVKEGEIWIDVDLTKKVLSLIQYDKPIFATYVATGVRTNPTIPGTYGIWYKVEKTRMRGRPPTAAKVYDLKNVPFVMYYRGSFSLHGTYWHDKFGSRQSSGCTNLTQGDAKFIFDRVNPVLTPETEKFAYSTDKNPGTIIYNHY